jgi:hypothetical protein
MNGTFENTADTQSPQSVAERTVSKQKLPASQQRGVGWLISLQKFNTLGTGMDFVISRFNYSFKLATVNSKPVFLASLA